MLEDTSAGVGAGCYVLLGAASALDAGRVCLWGGSGQLLSAELLFSKVSDLILSLLKGREKS